MIIVSPETHALLESAHFVARPFVQVIRYGPGGGEDLSHKVVRLSVSASMDNPVMQASVTFPLGEGLDSLSPFIAASMHNGGDPLFAPAAAVFIGFDISADGSVPMGNDVTIVFRGRVDRVRVSAKDGIAELQCRDLGAWWLNTVLQQTSMLGSEAGTEASEVMQQLISLAGLSGFAPVYTVTAPGLIRVAPADYMVYPQPFGPESVLEAMRRLAQQAGRDVRWFESKGGLAYYEPDRAVTTPDLILNGRRYEAITELSWGDEDVRNFWEGYWQNDDSSVGGPVRLYDQASITRYGPRFARVYLQRAENIRSEAQMTAFLSAALADSKDPFASHGVSMPIEPRVELNDFHRYEANFREYDADMEFAVAAFRHDWQAASKGQPGVTRTTIRARAKPIAAYRDYRRSLPPQVLVSTLDVPPDLWAPENTLHLKVDSLA